MDSWVLGPTIRMDVSGRGGRREGGAGDGDLDTGRLELLAYTGSSLVLS